MSQLPKVFGVPGGEGSFFQQFAQFIANLPQTNPYALALGAGTIALILIIKRYKPLIPGALVALILGTVIAGVFNLNAKYGVAVVGDIPTGMPSPTIPRIDPSDFIYLIGGAVGIVFLAVGETLGTARTFAAKYHYEVNAGSGTAGDGRGEYRLGPVSGHHHRHEPVQHGQRRSGG